MSIRNGCSLLLAVVFCLLVTAQCTFHTLDHLKPKASDKTQEIAVVEMLERLLGNRSTEFIVSVNRSLSKDGLDVCELRSTNSNTIVATGSSGVAVAFGIYNYLKYKCNCHVSWSGDQLDLPRPLPKLTDVLYYNMQHRKEQSTPAVGVGCYRGSKEEKELCHIYTWVSHASFREDLIKSTSFDYTHPHLKKSLS